MMTKFSARATLAAITLFASAGLASAQDAERLTQADADGDGNISWEEVVDMRMSAFERLDRNDDGFVDTDDSPRFGPAKARFEEALGELVASDADADGRVSETEMLEAPAPMFTSGDANEDGILSAEEITALRESVGQEG